MRWKKYSFLLFVILFVGSSKAYISVNPAGYDVDFVPNSKSEFTFRFNTDNPDAEYETYIDTDLKDYAKLNKKSFRGTDIVTVSINFPSEIEIPGVHRIRVGVSQVPSEDQFGGSVVGVVASVIGVIDVDVPYPGKYAEITLETNDANAGEEVILKLKINSRGKEAITPVSRLEIYDEQNNSVETFNLGEKIISAGETFEYEKKFDTENYKPGNYKAIAVVQYDTSKESRAESSFRLGELFVDIASFNSVFSRGKINPMSIEVQSFWNNDLENVFVEGKILKYNIFFQTSSVELPKWDKRVLTGYFDTTSIEEDEFQAVLTVHYADKTTIKTVDLKFVKETNYLLIGFISTIVLLVVLLIGLSLWIIRLKKNARKRKK